MKSSRPDGKGAFATRPALARQVALKRGFARAVLFAESLVPPLLPALSIVALFLAIAWFGIFRQLPDWLRWIAVFALTFAFIASLIPFARLRWPDAASADRLLETRNNLPHQPVSVQEDQPAFDSPFARALWQEHQVRMAEKIASLDAGLPSPDVASHDKYALRAIPALLLVAAFGFSFSNGAGTLSDAFRQQPNVSTDPDLRIDAWVTPPYYTARPPVYLTAGSEAATGPVNVPQFSELTVRVTGGKAGEVLKFQPSEGGDAVDVALKADDQAAKPSAASSASSVNATATPAPPRTYALKIEQSGHLTVNGEAWDFTVIPDKAPEIAFSNQPRRSINGALEIGFTAKDDYGIKEAHALIVPVDSAGAGATPLYPLPEFKLDLPRQNGSDIKGLTSRNLTEHPLAGKRVRITLVATDSAGQTGMSKPHVMVLPARSFSEPLAAAVAEERQTFALDTRAMPQAIALNEALALRPEETIPKLSNFLLIRSALARMKLARDETMLKDTADYLWEIALGIEDGDLSQAERRLRDAQKELSEALARNAPDEEIQKLMAELRAAMKEFMTAMAERMQQSPAQQQQSQNVLRQRDLENMMNQIENLARSGNKEAAQQMLSELQRLMNNLQTGKPSQQAQNQQNNPMRQQIDKLGELLQQQQKLMDQTFGLDQALQDRMQRGDPNDGDQSELFEQPPEGQPPNQQPGQQQQGQQDPKQGSPTDQMTEQQLRDALKQLKAQQDALGQKLKELQKGLADQGMKPGENFAEAEREMQGAGKALGEGEGSPAVEGQGKAMQALRKGAQEMMNQIMQAMKGQQPGQGQGQGPGMAQGQGGQNGRDPLGRPRSTPGPDFGDTVKVPDEIDVQRAREILDAIRDKLGDNSNGEIERHYLERLLDIR